MPPGRRLAHARETNAAFRETCRNREAAMEQEQPDVEVHSLEDADPPEGARAIIEIGRAGELTAAARARSVAVFRKLVERHAEWIALTIHGYGTDPRELWEIPEVIDYVAHWLLEAGITSLEEALAANLSADTITWLGACLATAYAEHEAARDPVRH
jgi:hypothetical protein